MDIQYLALLAGGCMLGSRTLYWSMIFSTNFCFSRRSSLSFSLQKKHKASPQGCWAEDEETDKRMSCKVCWTCSLHSLSGKAGVTVFLEVRINVAAQSTRAKPTTEKRIPLCRFHWLLFFKTTKTTAVGGCSSLANDWAKGSGLGEKTKTLKTSTSNGLQSKKNKK